MAPPHSISNTRIELDLQPFGQDVWQGHSHLASNHNPIAHSVPNNGHCETTTVSTLNDLDADPIHYQIDNRVVLIRTDIKDEVDHLPLRIPKIHSVSPTLPIRKTKGEFKPRAHPWSLLVASVCVALVLLTNSFGQKTMIDPGVDDRKQVDARLPLLDLELKTAISERNLSEVAVLQRELDTMLSTLPLLVKQHRAISNIVIDHRLAGMLPALTKHLSRPIYIGSSMRAYTTQYPLTMAIVAFGTHSLNPIKEQLLNSKTADEVDPLAYCLIGVLGVEETSKTLHELQNQTRNTNLRNLLEQAAQMVVVHGKMFASGIAEYKIPHVPEHEILNVAIPARAISSNDEPASPSPTPLHHGSNITDKVPVQTQAIVASSQESSKLVSPAKRWSIVALLIVVPPALFWLLTKPRN